ncbi:MAG: hypothetical protein V4662_21565 [Verrucomicrobiota bacterium]
MSLHLSLGLHAHQDPLICTAEQREVLISALNLYQTKLAADAIVCDEGSREEVLLEALVAEHLCERLKEFRVSKHEADANSHSHAEQAVFSTLK